MIKKLFIFLFLISSITTIGSGWRKASEGTYSQLNDVFFISETLGWIAGSDATILLTTDGGYTWNAPTDPLPVSESMYSIFFIDENIGFAGGNNDLVLKTVNGGNTWTQVSSINNDTVFYDDFSLTH